MNDPNSAQSVERSDIQPFQGWGIGMTSTQGDASLTLGFGIESTLGFKNRATPNANEPTAAQQCHAGDADAIPTARGDGNVVAFVERPEMAVGASLMAVRSTAAATKTPMARA